MNIVRTCGAPRLLDRRVWPLLLFPLLAAGCAERIHPIGSGYLFEPDKDERELWTSTTAATAELAKNDKLYHDPQLTAYIERVALRVLAAPPVAFAPLKFNVFILENDTLNAAAFPNGTIVIHTAMLGRIRSEAQLAMLLGHEITHATHRHAYQRFEKEEDKQITLLIIKTAAGAAGGLISTGVSTISDLTAQAMMAGYGRDLEREADQVGLFRATQAGYDPHAAIGLWSQMLEAKGESKGLYMYASHPRMQERLESCQDLATRMPAELVGAAKDVGEDRYVRSARALIERELRQHEEQGRTDLAESTRAYLQRFSASAGPQH